MTFRSWVRTLVVAKRHCSDPVIFNKLGCKVFVWSIAAEMMLVRVVAHIWIFQRHKERGIAYMAQQPVSSNYRSEDANRWHDPTAGSDHHRGLDVVP
jgi:hypothetical protein